MLKIENNKGWVTITDQDGDRTCLRYRDISGFYMTRTGYKETCIDLLVIVGGVRQSITQYYSANIKDYDEFLAQAKEDFDVLREHLSFYLNMEDDV